MADIPNPASSTEELASLRRQVRELQQQVERLKGLEQAAEQERDRLRAVLENMPVMIDAFDEDGTIVLWNHECERVTGYSAAEVIRNPKAMELMSPNRDYYEQKMREWRELGDDYRGFVWDLTAKDGSVKTIAWSNISARVPMPPWKTWGIAVDLTEQSNQQKAVCESEERFRSVFEKMPDGLLVADTRGRFLMANDAICRMTGYDADEITRLSVRDIHPEEDIPEVVRTFEKGNEGLLDHVADVPLKTKDGRVQRVDIHGIHLCLGNTPCVMGVFRDVTVQREQERALQESEAWFRSVFDGVPDGLLIADPSTGRFRMANKAICKLTGYDAQELVQLSVQDIHPQESLQTTLDRFGRMARGEAFLTEDIPLKTKDGRITHVDIHGTAVHAGGAQYVLGVFRDAKERRLNEIKLRESEERFRAIFENAPDSIVVLDFLTGKFLMVNRAFCDTTGYDPHELSQISIEDLFPKETALAVREGLNQGTRGQLALPGDFHIRTKDGRTLCVNVRPVFLNIGGTRYGMGILHDVTDQRRATKALEESEARFRSIFENAPDGFVVADVRTNKIVMANKAICDLTGYDRHELLGFHVQDLHPQKSLPVGREGFEELGHGRIPAPLDVAVKTRDGRAVYVNIHPMLLHMDGTSYAMGIFRDITEQRRAAAALEESEKRMRDVFDNMPIGVYHTDPEGRVVMANPAFVRMLGYSSFEELAKQKTDQMYAKSQYPRTLFRQQVEKDGCVVDFESDWRRPDGTMIHTIENARVVRDAQGRVLYYEGTIEDVTERNRILAALLQSENRYRTLVESAGETIVVVDDAGKFLFMNGTAAERLGGKPEDYLGKTMWELFPQPIADRQMGSIRNVIRTGQGINVVVPTDLRGASRWYNTTVVPLPASDGQSDAALIIARDIHELRQTQKELDEYRTHMARAERLASLGTLSATIAHEMNQPLTVIRLNLQNCLALMENNGSPPEMISDLKDSLEGVSIASSIVSRFRTFARHSARRTPGRASLQTVAQRIVRLWEEESRKQKVRIVLEGLDRVGDLDFDGGDMEQIFFCLVENAIQAADGRRDHQLSIQGTVAGNSVEIRFRDDCGGIAPENVDRIFDPFFTTKDEKVGTGLGLCIVEQAVSRAGGKVYVANQPGEGATFVVLLPFQSQ
jgi:two-component system, NtrC family, sensor kinase